MEGQLGLSELSVLLWVSAVEGCPLSGVPLYKYFQERRKTNCVVYVLAAYIAAVVCASFALFGTPGQKVKKIDDAQV